MSSEIDKLLDVKKAIDRKRPKFLREGAQNSVRIGSKWRRPRGLQSKMRHQFAGHRKRVNVGFRGPAKVRGLDASGLALTRVENLAGLKDLDPKTHKIVIAAKVGLKSRILLLEKAAEKGFKIFACKDPSKKIAELKDWLSKRKEDRAKKMKSKKESSAVKVKKKKAELEEKVTAEEKKKEEKKEMEKILTKRG